MAPLLKKTLFILLLGGCVLGCASPYHGSRYYDQGGYGSPYAGGYGRGGYAPQSAPSWPWPFYGSYAGDEGEHHQHHHDSDHDGD